MTTPTQGEHAQTAAQVQRYKIGYPTDSWGERSSTPSGIPDHAGAWVRYEDHAAQVAALTAAPNAKASIHALSQINAAQRELLDAMGAHTAQPAAEGAAKVNWWEVDGDKYDDSITRAPPAPTAQAAPAADPAYSEACSLAKALFEKHYRQEPDYASGRVVWSLCDTTAGVISQIDNMVSGLARAPAAGAVAGPVAAGMVPVAEVVECGTMGQQTLREIDGRWRWLSIGERLYAQADTGFIATPTPAAQADSAPSPVGGYGLVDGAAICEAAAKKWEREAKRHKRAPGSLPSQHEARDLERARLCRNLAEKIRSTKPAQAADSVLEDAARYRWLRQEHERVDPVCHLTWKRNLQRDSSEWVNTAVLDTAIDKARKQGANHD